MKSTLMKFALMLLLVAVWSGVPAMAELSVSVTITGPIDEILPLLQQLKGAGVGLGSTPGQSGLKLEMTSVAAPPEAAPQSAPQPAPQPGSGAPTPIQPPPAAPTPPPAPKLALTDAKAEPADLKAGDTLLLTVKATDPDHLIDTVASTVIGTPGVVDLYDNGTHGDVTPADGVWSAAVTLDPKVQAGEYAIVVTAYNRNGIAVDEPATTPGAQPQPLSAKTKIVVK